MRYPSVLDNFGILSGTDKSSIRWDYLRQYEDILLPWRDENFNLIEIGVAGGSSVATWTQFFTQAIIVGIEIAEEARRITGDRINIEIGSQADGPFLDSVCAKFPPSIIIDDGSHRAEHIMFSFQRMFPYLAPGGWYIIEDFQITIGVDEVPLSPHDFFSASAKAMMFRRPGNHPDAKTLSEIDRIDVAPGIIFIRKRDHEARKRRINAVEDLVARSNKPNNHLWLSEVLMSDLNDLDKAEAAAKRAIELYGTVAIYHLGLSRVREQKGDLIGALEAAKASAAVEPNNYHCHVRIGEMLALVGDERSAYEAFIRALEVCPNEALAGQIEHSRRNALARFFRS